MGGRAERESLPGRATPRGERAEDLDTARLVTRFQAGDPGAFDALYRRYFDRVYAYLRVMLKSREEAEDVAQEVFLRAFQGLPAYQRRRQPFRHWLFTIVRNCALTQLARQGRLDLMEPSEIDRRNDRSTSEEERIAVLGWISDVDLMMFVERLPLPQQQVLLLRHLLDLNNREIAAILEMTPVAVRSLHSRAVFTLGKRLKAIGRGPEQSRERAPMEAGVKQAPVLRNRRFALGG